MQDLTKKISKKEYDEIIAVSPTGVITNAIQSKYFDISIICGYGLYGAKAYCKDGEYYIDYKIGGSCD